MNEIPTFWQEIRDLYLEGLKQGFIDVPRYKSLTQAQNRYLRAAYRNWNTAVYTEATREALVRKGLLNEDGTLNEQGWLVGRAYDDFCN